MVSDSTEERGGEGEKFYRTFLQAAAETLQNRDHERGIEIIFREGAILYGRKFDEVRTDIHRVLLHVLPPVTVNIIAQVFDRDGSRVFPWDGDLIKEFAQWLENRESEIFKYIVRGYTQYECPPIGLLRGILEQLPERRRNAILAQFCSENLTAHTRVSFLWRELQIERERQQSAQ